MHQLRVGYSSDRGMGVRKGAVLIATFWVYVSIFYPTFSGDRKLEHCLKMCLCTITLFEDVVLHDIYCYYFCKLGESAIKWEGGFFIENHKFWRRVVIN